MGLGIGLGIGIGIAIGIEYLYAGSVAECWMLEVKLKLMMTQHEKVKHAEKY